MITPLDEQKELRVAPESSYRCLELSPDGRLYAAATIHSVELWSSCGDVMLLARCSQQRPSGYSKALLKRVFLIWDCDSSSFVVIWSEGRADYYTVSYGTRKLEDVYADQDDPIVFPQASLKLSYSTSIEQFGYPVSACAFGNRILVATDSGMICELNWKGNSVGRSLSRMMEQATWESSGLQDNQRVVSLSAYSELNCLAIVLNDSTCYLLDMNNSLQATNCCRFHTEASENVRQVQFCPGRSLLAVISTSLTVNVYSVTRTPEDEYALCCNSIALVDVRQIPHLQPSPLYNYDSIVSLTWCRSQPVFALGLRYQGLIVWSLQSGVVYIYKASQGDQSSDSTTTPEGKECIGVATSTEVSCCAFSASGSHLLFNVPYEQVISPEDGLPYVRESRLFLQPFYITSDSVSATEQGTIFAYSDHSIYHLRASEMTSTAVLPARLPMPYEFISAGERILGHVQSPSGRNVLLFTAHSICIYQSAQSRWSHALQIATNCHITTAVWLSDFFFLLATTPSIKSDGDRSSRTPVQATIRALRVRSLAFDQAIQEIDLKLLTVPPSCSSSPLQSLPHIITSMQFSEGKLLCCSSHGVYYIFSLADPESILLPRTTHLPISFLGRGLIDSQVGIQYAWLVHHIRPAKEEEEEKGEEEEEEEEKSEKEEEEEEEEEEETMMESILAWHRDGRITLTTNAGTTMREMVEQTELFSSMDQVLFCDFGDRGYIQTAMAFSSFFFFAKGPTLTSWIPDYEAFPPASINHHAHLPSRLGRGFCGYAWAKNALLSLQPSSHAIIPITVCSTHLFLASLLFSENYTVATATLYLAHSHGIPSLLASLEYLLHCALNSNDHFFLTSTLQLLAHLPQFIHLLICCLRKQERSTWPFAIHKPSDILHLFNGFLLRNDLEYATTTIAILQGLLCSLYRNPEQNQEQKEEDPANHDRSPSSRRPALPDLNDAEEMAELRGLFQKINPHISNAFPFLFETPHSSYCIAHRSGLHLLFVCLTLRMYDTLADVYRFLLMEEARHVEANQPLPRAYHVDAVLTKLSLHYLRHGLVAPLLELFRQVKFVWTGEKQEMEVENYSSLLNVWLEECEWEMIIEEVIEGESEKQQQKRRGEEEEEEENVIFISQPKGETSVTEEEFKLQSSELLHNMMIRGCAEWSLLLMLLLLKTKQIVNLAIARDDIWKGCLRDLRESKNEMLLNLLDTIQEDIIVVQEQMR